MNIERVDEFDDEQFAEWFAVLRAAEKFAWPEEPGWFEHELKVLYRDHSDGYSLLSVARNEAGEATGCLDVSFPTKDNLHMAHIMMFVHPEHRRQGVGRALVGEAESLARAASRTTLGSWSDDPADAESSAGKAFAESVGFSAGREDARRRLSLPVDLGHLESLEHASLPFADGYEIVTWTRACPKDWLEGRIELSRIMSTDAPQGDLNYEEEIWDEARVRTGERQVEEMNRDLLAAGALDKATGNMIAFTEIGVPREEPRVVHQLDTVVAPAHRGHRLGMLLKIANLRELMVRWPQTEHIITGNAVSNAPMIRVNEEIGFKLYALGYSWQKALS